MLLMISNHFITVLIFLFTAFPNFCSASSKLRNESTTIKVQGPVKIPPEKVQGAFFKMMSMLEAHNLKQKYELGKLAVHLIHHMDKKGLLQEKKDEKPSSRGVDKDPIASSQKIDGLYKNYTTSGFSGIEKDLRAALKVNAGFMVDGLMYLAIGYQNVNLVKDLIKTKGGLIVKTYDMYKFALATLVDENTEACEEIVDLISGPEAYTTPRNWVFRQLNFGFACLSVLDYIHENNYPMLKRSLDEGLNPNQTFETHGSLLGASVLFGCVRCVKILVESGANVNTPLKYKPDIYMAGTTKTESPEGWMPLMLAVADGQVRIVKLLLGSIKSINFNFNVLLKTASKIKDKALNNEIELILRKFLNDLKGGESK